MVLNVAILSVYMLLWFVWWNQTCIIHFNRLIATYYYELSLPEFKRSCQVSTFLICLKVFQNRHSRRLFSAINCFSSIQKKKNTHTHNDWWKNPQRRGHIFDLTRKKNDNFAMPFLKNISIMFWFSNSI